MSEKLQLEVFDKFITVPGCAFTRNAAKITELNEETFRAAFGFLQTVEGCSSWWWGDLIIAHEEWQAEGAVDPRKALGNYASKWATLIGREAGTVSEWVNVSTFYPSHSRSSPLSWAHYQEAKDGAGGDLSVAQDWLDRAYKQGWSKTELRAAIRLAKRRVSEPDEPMPTATIHELVAFNRWSRTQINRIADMDESERATLRRELEPAERLIRALDESQKNSVIEA